jgi:hypothetical protein
VILTSYLWRRAGQNLEAEVFLVAEAVRSPLDRADLVVQSLDEAQGDFVVRVAVRCDAGPVPVDHLCELLVRLQTLPLERGDPVVEEATRPAGHLVAPELLERLLEKVSGVQTFVGVKEQPQCSSAGRRQVVPTTQEDVLRSLDPAPTRARQSGVLAFAYGIEGVLKMPQDVELVVNDPSPRSVLEGRIAKALPHVHHREADFPRLFRAQPGVELIEAGFGAVVAAEPNRPAAVEVADHDPVRVPSADADLVDADDARRRVFHASQLLGHVLRLERLDCVPIEVELLGHRLDGAVAAAPAHKEREPFGVKRIVGDPVEPFSLHAATPPAENAPDGEVEIDASVAAGEVANPARPLIVEDRQSLTASPAGRFFRLLRSVRTTALGSPKTPCRVASGSKPGKRYRSRKCRVVLIELSWRVSRPSKRALRRDICWNSSRRLGRIYPLDFTKSLIEERSEV